MDLGFGDFFGSKIILKSRSILQDGSRFWECFGRKNTYPVLKLHIDDVHTWGTLCTEISDTKFISLYLTVRSHIRQDFNEKSGINFFYLHAVYVCQTVTNVA